MMRVPVCDPSREPKISDEAILALIQEHGYSQYDAQIILKFGGLNTSELRFGKTLLTADISGESLDIRLKNAYHRGKARHKKLLIFLDRQKNIAAFLSKYTQAEIFYAFNSGVLNGFSLPELINEIQYKEFYNLETARNEILYQYLLYEEGKIKMESRKDCEGTPQSAPDTVQVNRPPKIRQSVTQATMASMCNVEEGTVKKWDKGKAPPGYPGRTNLAFAKQFAENYKNQRAVNREGRSMSRAMTGYSHLENCSFEDDT